MIDSNEPAQTSDIGAATAIYTLICSPKRQKHVDYPKRFLQSCGKVIGDQAFWGNHSGALYFQQFTRFLLEVCQMRACEF